MSGHDHSGTSDKDSINFEEDRVLPPDDSEADSSEKDATQAEVLGDLISSQENDDTLQVPRETNLGGIPPSASMEGMDTVVLETSSTVESVDLETLSPCASVEKGIEDLSVTDNTETEKTDAAENEEETGDNMSKSPSGGDIRKYFTVGDSALEQSGDEFFDTLTSVKPEETETEQKDEVNTEKKLESDVKTESSGEPEVQTINRQLSHPEEATPVSFEEAKGAGNPMVIGSTENVSKFFTEDAGGTDEIGKSFFDTFTAGENDETDNGQTTQSPLPSPRNQPAAKTSSQPIPINAGAVPVTPPVPLPGSPLQSPVHQAFGSSVGSVGGQTSPLPSPLHQAGHPLANAVVTPGGATGTFPIMEDPFSTSLSMSDMDRRYNAWIPSELTRQALVAKVTSPPGTYFPEPEQMTMPGMLVDDPQGDPVRDLVQKYLGDQEASKRETLKLSSVPVDEEGLRQLIAAECFRSAVDLTGNLLTERGQGINKVDEPTRNTPETLQIWFCRICLLMKLRLYSHAESECQAFGSLDRPDLYFEYYPDVHPGRRGTMVPFGFRVLHAELPQFLGKSQESLDRLYYLQAITKKILSNLESGLAEDGSMLQLSDDSRKASRELWEAREVKLLYSIGNCLLNIKDYNTAIEIYQSLLKKDARNKEGLLCGVGRIHLQMGDMKMAEKYFDQVESLSDSGDPIIKCRNLMNKGFVALGRNQFADAHVLFEEAVKLDPTNAVAVNNMGVCCLYMGKLKEALTTLENLVNSDPVKYLQEGILFNLCTLYELESSRAMQKKQALLGLVNKHKGNGFNIACLKMS